MKTPLLSHFPPFNRRLLGLAVGLGLLAAAPAAQAQTVYGLAQNGTVFFTSSL